MHRIQDLVVRADDDQLLGFLIRSLSQSPNNILTMFDYDLINYDRPSQDTDVAVDDQFLLSLPKTLVWLKLPKIRIGRLISPMQTFVHLTEFFVTVLWPASLSDIRTLLEGFPNLETFTLRSFNMRDADSAPPSAQPVSLPRLKILTFVQDFRFIAAAHLCSVFQFNANHCVDLMFPISEMDLVGVHLYLRNRQRQVNNSFRRVVILLNDWGTAGSRTYNGRLLIRCNKYEVKSSSYKRHLFPDARGSYLEPGALLLNGLYGAKDFPPPVFRQMITLLDIAGFERIEKFEFAIRISNLPYQSSTLFPVFDQLTQVNHLLLAGLTAIEAVIEFLMQRVHHRSDKIPLPLLQHIVLHVSDGERSAFVTTKLDDLVGAFKARQESGGERLRTLKVGLEKDSGRNVEDKLAGSGIAEKCVVAGLLDERMAA